MSPETARAVCAELLPRAPGLTTGQLIEQIKKLAIALDPEWARRRYEQAVANRKVVGYRNPDGSANLSGCNLPVDRVAAASGHIDTLAKADKHAGDPRPIDHLRADLFLGMTDGTYTGLDDADIINQLLAAGQLHESANQGNHDNGDSKAGDSNGSAAPTGPLGQLAPAVAGGSGIELRVRLSTLLGHDQYPAELAGWGPVDAELARELPATLGGALWRFAITDEHGQLRHCGITRARPTGARVRVAGCRDRRATGSRRHPGHPRQGSHPAGCLGRGGGRPCPPARRGHHRRGPLRWRPKPAHSRRCATPLLGDPRPVLHHGRLPCPARTADKNHTCDHGHGGPTTGDNLGDVCRHDHRLKYEGGWRLHQPEPGHFCWTKPVRTGALHGFNLYDRRAAIVGTETATAIITDARDIAEYETCFATYEALAVYDADARQVLDRLSTEYSTLEH